MLISIEGLDGSGKTTTERVLVEKYQNQDIITTREPYNSEWLGKQVKNAISDEEAHPLSTLLLFMADHTYHYHNIIQPALDDGKTVITDRYIDSRYAYQGGSIETFVEGDAVKFIQKLQETEWELDHTNTDVSTALRIAEVEIPTEIYADTPVLGRYFYGLSKLDEEGFTTDFTLGENILSDPTDFPGLLEVDTPQNGLSWSRLPELTIFLDAEASVCVERIANNREERDRFEFLEFLDSVKNNYEQLVGSTDRFVRIDAEQPEQDMVAEIENFLEISEIVSTNSGECSRNSIHKRTV